MAESLIQVRSLVKDYKTPAGPLKVLRGIDLEIGTGEFVGIVGPSGGGKTTFLNMVTGVDRPTSGTVTVGGQNVSGASERKLTRWRARNIGIVFQFFQLLPTLTVVENVIMPMDFVGVHRAEDRRPRALALLDRLGIADQANKTPDLLSGGQQQRVAIARALANDPVLVIGDEPTANLDYASAAVVFDVFRELKDRGHTVIIATHDREVGSLVPEVLTLSEGLLKREQLSDAAASKKEARTEAAALQHAGARR